MPFYDQDTISEFAAAKGHQIWPFPSNTDDPAGDPAHPNETADFLRDRIWAYCQDVISYVRAYHPAAVFECLWPLDANQGKPGAGSLGQNTFLIFGGVLAAPCLGHHLRVGHRFGLALRYAAFDLASLGLTPLRARRDQNDTRWYSTIYLLLHEYFLLRPLQ